jgi:NAD(P)-dependent dehydrogenase (short-subunit alcohol dehydrogenase family)
LQTGVAALADVFGTTAHPEIFSLGIGAAIAKSFAAEGASIVVNYASSKAGAESVVAAIIHDVCWQRRSFLETNMMLKQS